jgi:hypothetical protein
MARREKDTRAPKAGMKVKKRETREKEEAVARVGKGEAEANVPTGGAAALKGSVGKKVELEGYAFDAKGGPVILIDNQVPVYIPDMDSWPSELLGKVIKVSGTLRYKRYLHVATVDPSGAISQGIDPEGDVKDYVIESPKWSPK